MTWTAPRTYVTDEVVNAPILNTHLRYQLLALVHPYDSVQSDFEVASNATEQPLYTRLITGNDLGVNGLALLRLDGDVLSNAGHTLRVRVKFGGAPVLDSGAFAPTTQNSATRQPWWLEVRVQNRSVAGAQLVVAEYMCSQPGATTGLGKFDTTQSVTAALTLGVMQNTAAVDTSVDQTLQVTVQWSGSSASSAFRRRAALLYLGQN